MTDPKEQTKEQKKAADELAQLKKDAISIGMIAGTDFNYNINKENLLVKIEEYQKRLFAEAEAKRKLEYVAPKPLPANLAVTPPPNETKNQRRSRKLKEANRLVRVTIICNHPNKREWDGEILTGGNSYIGSIKKFVPYNSEEPYHVPRILLNVLEDRQCTVFRTVKTKQGTTSKPMLIKEFSITYHDDLTLDEHADIAKLQAMSKGETIE